MTVLDKSKADWSVHRQEADLDKDLADHNRSNDRYVDKQVLAVLQHWKLFFLASSASEVRIRPEQLYHRHTHALCTTIEI